MSSTDEQFEAYWQRRLDTSLAHVSTEVAALQARIDALMLEYCPDEMTPEQVANWAKHQRKVEV